MLKVRELACYMGERRLFSPVSFSIAGGGIMQLRGENGVGKSTLLRCVVGLPVKHSGKVVCSSSLVFIAHQNLLHPDLTVQQNLDFFGIDLVACDLFSVSSFSRLKVRELSAGQKQRVSLTRLQVARCSLWILDEPFANLDPDGKQILLTLIQQHTQQQGAVLLANHESLGFGEQLCLA